MYPSFTSTNLQPFQLTSPDHYITLDDDTILNQLLYQEHLLSNDHSNRNDISTHQQFARHDININTSLQFETGKCSNNNGDDGFNKPKGSNKRRRSSKGDRHSKINTIHGPRDRRMRLSLEVSKKFFALQDMLGYDKPSKTVEWLLVKSNSNIQELIPYGQSSFSGVCISESSTSKCINDDQDRKLKKKISRGVRKRAYLLRPLAKETREIARKRARERTLEKSNKLACVSGGDDQFSKLRPFLDPTTERGANCLGYSITNQPEQPRSSFYLKQRIVDNNSSSMIRGWNPTFLFDNQQTGVHAQERQLNDSFRYLE